MACARPCSINRTSRERQQQADIDLMIYGKYIIWSHGRCCKRQHRSIYMFMMTVYELIGAVDSLRRIHGPPSEHIIDRQTVTYRARLAIWLSIGGASSLQKGQHVGHIGSRGARVRVTTPTIVVQLRQDGIDRPCRHTMSHASGCAHALISVIQCVSCTDAHGRVPVVR